MARRLEVSMVKLLYTVAATAFAVSASVLPVEAFTIDGSVNAVNQYASSGFVSGSFSNAYTFTLSGTSIVNASVNGNPGGSISLSDFGIFSGSPTGLYTEETTPAPPTTTSPSLLAFTNVITLTAGNYFIGVSGGSTSTQGTYNGTLSVSAIPLPSTVALFGMAVMSLGVVGGLRGRYRKKIVASTAI